MASLKELCTSVPQKLLRVQTAYNVMQRMQESYKGRMNDLASETEVFEQCRQARPMRKKCHESASKEQAGRINNVIVTKRFGNSRLTCVCMTKAW